MTHLRRTLAMVAVVAALLVVAALFKQARCSCAEGGLPYETIAITSVIIGVLAIGAYLAAGYFGSRASHSG